MRVNLPPLHILTQKMIPDFVKFLVEDESKEYYRKGDEIPHLMTNYVHMDQWASIGNLGKNAEHNFSMPIDTLI